MDRSVVVAVGKLVGEALLITVIVGIIIAALGYFNHWEGVIAYSNAFFIAGAFVFGAGAASKMGGGQDWHNAQLLFAESFRGMSSGERASAIVAASESMRLLILGVVSGVLLMIVSWVVAKGM